MLPVNLTAAKKVCTLAYGVNDIFSCIVKDGSAPLVDLAPVTGHEAIGCEWLWISTAATDKYTIMTSEPELDKSQEAVYAGGSRQCMMDNWPS